jgi:hypothetical protein
MRVQRVVANVVALDPARAEEFYGVVVAGGRTADTVQPQEKEAVEVQDWSNERDA